MLLCPRYYKLVLLVETRRTQQSNPTMRWVPLARRAALTTMRPRTSTRHRRALAAVDVPQPTTVAADARRRPPTPLAPTPDLVVAAAVVRSGGGGGAVARLLFEEDDGT